MLTKTLEEDLSSRTQVVLLYRTHFSQTSNGQIYKQNCRQSQRQQRPTYRSLPILQTINSNCLKGLHFLMHSQHKWLNNRRHKVYTLCLNNKLMGEINNFKVKTYKVNNLNWFRVKMLQIYIVRHLRLIKIINNQRIKLWQWVRQQIPWFKWIRWLVLTWTSSRTNNNSR